VDAHGYVVSIAQQFCSVVVIIHITWGSRVARSGRIGHARALKCGMSNKYRFLRFFLCLPNPGSLLANK